MRNARTHYAIRVAVAAATLLSFPALGATYQEYESYEETTRGGQNTTDQMQDMHRDMDRHMREMPNRMNNLSDNMDEYDVSDIPEGQVIHEGSITYITGGVGENERHMISSTAGNYNLLVSNADNRGLLTTDTNLILRDNQGEELIHINNAGPLFYANLPRGTYTLTAVNGGHRFERTFRVSGRHRENFNLVWNDYGVTAQR